MLMARTEEVDKILVLAGGLGMSNAEDILQNVFLLNTSIKKTAANIAESH
jgi:hypothetical protein